VRGSSLFRPPFPRTRGWPRKRGTTVSSKVLHRETGRQADTPGHLLRNQARPLAQPPWVSLTGGWRLLDGPGERDSLEQFRPSLLGDGEEGGVVWLVLIEVVHDDAHEYLQHKVHTDEDEDMDVHEHELARETTAKLCKLPRTLQSIRETKAGKKEVSSSFP